MTGCPSKWLTRVQKGDSLALLLQKPGQNDTDYPCPNHGHVDADIVTLHREFGTRLGRNPVRLGGTRHE
jgi:hypothetical protein